jgi:hypothetical protein
LAYVEYAMMKLSAFEWSRPDVSRQGEKICKMTEIAGSQNAKERSKCGQSKN